ncbi:hypothetical protein TRL7639_01783 [Falsiruegeria litorea R37]|uniref:Uncharacterized protein n=1 Tax=Falsiruegeria litorea R37 TaxID=1200284 RepID=A0A1Y5SB58_9RHOB|nr:hypothetical protein [Falsiruegeria litorea]SLN36609.1 hypothetical protein TRL7639_01783 [Falsiruegeria litorea R37]
MTEPLRQWQESRTLKGLIPWLLAFAAIFVFERNLEYRFVRQGRDLAGLADNALYLHRTTPELCVNQAVYAKLGNRYKLVSIGAVAGQTVTANAQGVEIVGTVTNLGEDWKKVAISEIDEGNIHTIPSGHVLLINTGFKKGDDSSGWGVAVIPNKDVGASLTHFLMTRDLTRIGQPAKDLGACQPRTVTR